MVHPGRGTETYTVVLTVAPIQPYFASQPCKTQKKRVPAHVCAQNNYVEINIFKLKSAPVLRRQTEI